MDFATDSLQICNWFAMNMEGMVMSLWKNNAMDLPQTSLQHCKEFAMDLSLNLQRSLSPIKKNRWLAIDLSQIYKLH